MEQPCRSTGLPLHGVLAIVLWMAWDGVPMHLDQIDTQILQMLLRDAQTPLKVIAASVGIAGSTCHERIKRLEASGIIRGSHLDLDLDVLGLSTQAIILVTLKSQGGDAINGLIAELNTAPEVRSVFWVAGRYHAVIHVMVRDIAHLKTFVQARLSSRDDVGSLETNVVFEASHNFIVPASSPKPGIRSQGNERI